MVADASDWRGPKGPWAKDDESCLCMGRVFQDFIGLHEGGTRERLLIDTPSYFKKCVDTRLVVCEHANEHVSYTTYLCGNAVVEIKHRKLCDKLDTDTPSYVNIRRGYVLVSENGAQIRHFSENVHVVTSQLTQFCRQRVALGEGMGNYV